ncbi:MAG: hypothetical protein Q9162_006049 [Coniocarpon cinnabarinum]
MAAFTKGDHHDLSALMEYDWSSLNAKKGSVVDVGGATGHVAMTIAEANFDLHCEVQDQPNVINKFKDVATDSIAGRVKFVAHDFFNAQPTRADVYIFRQIFHDWPDAYCIKILRALVPVLSPGCKVLANDFVVPRAGTLPPSQERQIRAMDMAMMSLFGVREREEDDWRALFQEADPRFQDIKFHKPKDAYMSLIETIWTAETK